MMTAKNNDTMQKWAGHDHDDVTNEMIWFQAKVVWEGFLQASTSGHPAMPFG